MCVISSNRGNTSERMYSTEAGADPVQVEERGPLFPRGPLPQRELVDAAVNEGLGHPHDGLCPISQLQGPELVLCDGGDRLRAPEAEEGSAIVRERGAVRIEEGLRHLDGAADDRVLQDDRGDQVFVQGGPRGGPHPPPPREDRPEPRGAPRWGGRSPAVRTAGRAAPRATASSAIAHPAPTRCPARGSGPACASSRRSGKGSSARGRRPGAPRGVGSGPWRSMAAMRDPRMVVPPGAAEAIRPAAGSARRWAPPSTNGSKRSSP